MGPTLPSPTLVEGGVETKYQQISDGHQNLIGAGFLNTNTDELTINGSLQLTMGTRLHLPPALEYPIEASPG